MKRTLFFLTLLALFAGSSEAQLNVWRWQNPLPEGDFLHAVQMFSLTTTYACGENGVFMRTSDGGATWEVQSAVLKFKGTWNALNFLTKDFGICCGDSGTAMKTRDGGSSWTLMPTGTTKALNGVIIIDTNIALMVMLNGGILETINGGATWFHVPFEVTLALYSIRKLRSDFLYITGLDGTLMVSNDTGMNWHKINTPNGNTFYSACFTDENNATLVGDNGLVLQSTNGGLDWARTDGNDVTQTLNAVDGKDPNHLAIAGNYGTLVYRTDSGWNKFSPGTSDHLKGISFFDTLNATAVGRDGVILRTTDGGKSWFFLPQAPQTTWLQSVAFPRGDTSLGIAVGYNGIIMRTSDGGKNWKIIPSEFSGEFRGVAWLDQTKVLAVGDYGAIFKSYDSGQSWKKLISPTNNTIYSVSFATPEDGLAVGDSNMVLKSIDAGESWIRQVNPGASYIDSNPISPKVVRGFLPLWSVSYPDKNHAFMSARLDNFISCEGGFTRIGSKSQEPLSKQQPFNYDTCAHLVAWSDIKPQSYVEAQKQYDSVRLYIERCATNNYSWDAFTSLDGAVGRLSTDSNRYERYREWLLSVLYLNTTAPEYFCRCIGSIIGTYIGKYAGIASLTIDTFMCHHHQECKGYCSQFSIDSNDLVHAGYNISSLPSMDSLGLSIILRHDANAGAPSPTTLPNLYLASFTTNPNPFTSDLTLDFTLNRMAYIQLAIYDVLGRLVWGDGRGSSLEAGEHTVHIDGKDLPSGTLYARISTGFGEVRTVKLVHEK